MLDDGRTGNFVKESNELKFLFVDSSMREIFSLQLKCNFTMHGAIFVFAILSTDWSVSNGTKVPYGAAQEEAVEKE